MRDDRREVPASEYAAKVYFAHLAEQHRPNLADVHFHTNLSTARLEKFERCLPDDLLADLEATQMMDWATASTDATAFGHAQRWGVSPSGLQAAQAAQAAIGSQRYTSHSEHRF